MKIILCTEQGEFVALEYVFPFDTPPEVVIWVGRIFRLFTMNTEETGVPEYREAFSFFIPKPEAYRQLVEHLMNKRD